MTWWSDQLTDLIGMASLAGNTVGPARLLTLSGKMELPLVALATEDLSRPFFEALDTDLGFVRPVRQAKSSLSDEQRGKLESILRWLIGGLTTWRMTDDVKGAKLVAMLIVAARFDEEGALWRALPDVISQNPQLGTGLVHVLSHFRVDPLLGFTRMPVSDGEHLATILKAEAEGDWSTLRELAEGLPYKHTASVVVSQSMRLLHRFFPAVLVEYGRTISQVTMAMHIVTELPVMDAFRLGTESGNNFLQFAAICRLFNQYNRVNALELGQEDALVELLKRVAIDTPRWASWTKAFAAHPYRASQMQPALGRCLATVDQAATQAYLDALVLQASDLGRGAVAACFAAFTRNAPLEKRQRVWRLAFDRWSVWNYGEGEAYGVLNEVSVSNLDFAIVGYAVECQTEEERNAFIAGCLDGVRGAEHVWHRSQSNFQGYVYRALSRIQPFAHAQNSGSDPDTWLWNPNGGYLVHLLNEPFWRIRYQLHKYEEVAARSS